MSCRTLLKGGKIPRGGERDVSQYRRYEAEHRLCPCPRLCRRDIPVEAFPVVKIFLQGERPGFDPLKILVECAHGAGLKFHAWINPFRVSSSEDTDSLPQGSPAQLLGTTAVIGLKNGIYFDPASTDVHALIYDGVREILDGYDVDGIHIDDYFYPTRDGSIDRAEYEKYVSDGGKRDLASGGATASARLRRDSVRSSRATEAIRFFDKPRGEYRRQRKCALCRCRAVALGSRLCGLYYPADIFRLRESNPAV